MNIFELLNDVIFIEDEEDLAFAKERLNPARAKVGDIIVNKNETIQSKEYIVKPLDTLKTVAQKLNITEEELLKITKTKELFIGQRISI